MATVPSTIWHDAQGHPKGPFTTQVNPDNLFRETSLRKHLPQVQAWVERGKPTFLTEDKDASNQATIDKAFANLANKGR